MPLGATCLGYRSRVAATPSGGGPPRSRPGTGGSRQQARTVAAVERIPALPAPATGAAQVAVLTVLYLALLAAAAAPSRPGFAAAAFAVAVAEGAVTRWAPFLGWALARGGVGDGVRGVLRALVAVLLAARLPGPAPVVGCAVALVAANALHGVRAALAQVVDYLRAPPVLSRNVPLDVRVPSALPPALLRPWGWAAAADLPALLGLALDPTGVGAAAGPAVTVLLAAALTGVVLVHGLALHRGGVREGVAGEVQRRLDEVRPEVVVYFAAAGPWRYQVETWLEPVERLGVPAVVVVRDGEVLGSLAATSLPVVCVPKASRLMTLGLPAATVALYPGNAGDNIHLLRRRELCSVFVGHGESDKSASTNPFNLVYDQIWVAGPLGRERYRGAGHELPDDRIVEIGRPQLLVPARERPAGVASVLYAPTWEGWGDEPFHTSLPHCGVALVRALLARPGIRLLYRPHPLTGSRDAAVRRAHEQVVRLLHEAGAAGPEAAPGPVPAPPVPRGDLLDLAVASGAGPRWSRREHTARVAAWSGHYWAAAPPDRHRVLTPPAPDLYDCFGAADLLVTDVSSVISDWLATEGPYAVLNSGGLPAADFLTRFPSARGGALLGPDLRGLEAFLDSARGGPDPTATDRRALRVALLGADSPDAQSRFRAAVDALRTAPPRGPRRPAGVPGDRLP